jgi:hypothetical protein
MLTVTFMVMEEHGMLVLDIISNQEILIKLKALRE